LDCLQAAPKKDKKRQKMIKSNALLDCLWPSFLDLLLRVAFLIQGLYRLQVLTENV